MMDLNHVSHSGHQSLLSGTPSRAGPAAVATRDAGAIKLLWLLFSTFTASTLELRKIRQDGALTHRGRRGGKEMNLLCSVMV